MSCELSTWHGKPFARDPWIRVWVNVWVDVGQYRRGLSVFPSSEKMLWTPLRAFWNYPLFSPWILYLLAWFHTARSCSNFRLCFYLIAVQGLTLSLGQVSLITSLERAKAQSSLFGFLAFVFSWLVFWVCLTPALMRLSSLAQPFKTGTPSGHYPAGLWRYNIHSYLFCISFSTSLSSSLPSPLFHSPPSLLIVVGYLPEKTTQTQV